jgi:Tol biopolymer transport system component
VPASTLVRVDRKGVAAKLNVPKEEHHFSGVRVSPDGSRVALQVIYGARSDISVIDTNAGTATRLTSDGKSIFPLWSPDGKRILFSGGAGFTRLLSLPADRSGAAELVTSAPAQITPASWPEERLPLVYIVESNDS